VESPTTDLVQLALSVARCRDVELARADPAHPCSTIVSQQSPDPASWQVPEGWAGALSTGRIVFVSSNPSISEAGDHQSGTHVERYPRGDWPDEEIADFVMHRFDSDRGWATADGRFLREDGTYSPKPVAFWSGVRKRASELLERTADPGRDYVMTEVVHCKSKKERGVAEAAAHCAQWHLDTILAATAAPVVVILGAKARNLLHTPWALPPGFGQKATVGTDENANLARRHLGGHDRLVAYAWHPSGMTGPKSMVGAYPQHLQDLRDVAQGRLDPAALDL
jgi:hypothetical protein